MANQDSNNNQDTKLAEHIEQVNAGNASLDYTMALVPELVEYKAAKESWLNTVQSTDRNEVWESVASATRPQATIHKLFQSKPMQMAVAAAILVVAMLSVFYIQYVSQPALMGEAGATMATVQLDDGSTITLRPHSKLYEVEQTDSRAAYKLEGEGYFDITSNKSRTFSVQSSSGKVSVLGTRFNLSSWGDRMQVFLEEGSVRVEALEQDSSLVLTPGDAAVVSSATAIPELQAFSLEEVTDWMNNQLVFQEKEIRFVIAEVEQQFNISITIPEALNTEKISGQLSLEDLETVLDDLEVALDGTFNQIKSDTYQFNSN